MTILPLFFLENVGSQKLIKMAWIWVSNRSKDTFKKGLDKKVIIIEIEITQVDTE